MIPLTGQSYLASRSLEVKKTFSPRDKFARNQKLSRKTTALYSREELTKYWTFRNSCAAYFRILIRFSHGAGKVFNFKEVSTFSSFHILKLMLLQRIGFSVIKLYKSRNFIYKELNFSTTRILPAETLEKS